MGINRGYVPQFKITGNIQSTDTVLPLTAIIKCPNCEAENVSKGMFDDNAESLITCSECRYTTSKWNYNFVRTEGE